MIFFVLFVALFLGGPALFRHLLTRGFSTGSLGLAAAGFAALAMAVRFAFQGDERLVVLGVFLSLIWLAWIAVLVMGAQALRTAMPGAEVQRWTGILGSAGTTVPWFGLAYARLVAG